MAKHKTTLERLAFKIAEQICNEYEIEPEDIYSLIYLTLPFDMEALAAEEERETRRKLTQPDGPSLVGRLREAVYADKGTPLRMVIETAIAKIRDGERLARKVEHGCTDSNCEICDVEHASRIELRC